jgi:hypothetical protein
VRRVVVLLSIAARALLLARAASAGLVFPSVVERVIGARIDMAPVREALSDTTSRARVEVADAEWYGIEGLRTNGVRAAGAVRAVFFTGSVATVDAAVGTQARVVVEVGYTLRHRWQACVRGGIERLSLAGNPQLTTRVAGMASRIDVGRFTTVADLDATDTAGPGYETSLSLAARTRAGPAQLIGTIRIDGDRYIGAGIAVFARLHRSLALLAGYDDGSESMRAGMVIDWHGVEVATGVFGHPVLGMSQAVSIACFR